MVTYEEYCDNVAKRNRNYTEKEFNNVLELFPNLDIEIDWDTYLDDDYESIVGYILSYGLNLEGSVEDYSENEKSIELCDCMYVKHVEHDKAILEKYGWTISNYDESIKDALDSEEHYVSWEIDRVKSELDNLSKENKDLFISKIKELIC